MKTGGDTGLGTALHQPSEPTDLHQHACQCTQPFCPTPPVTHDGFQCSLSHFPLLSSTQIPPRCLMLQADFCTLYCDSISVQKTSFLFTSKFLLLSHNKKQSPLVWTCSSVLLLLFSREYVPLIKELFPFQLPSPLHLCLEMCCLS